MVWEVKHVLLTPKDENGLPAASLHLIVARNVRDPGGVKYFVSNAPPETPVKELLHVAFSRWRVERCFEDQKTELGFDHFEGRSYVGLKRHQAITAVSHLFLSEVRQQLRGEKSGELQVRTVRNPYLGRQRLVCRELNCLQGLTFRGRPKVGWRLWKPDCCYPPVRCSMPNTWRSSAHTRRHYRRDHRRFGSRLVADLHLCAGNSDGKMVRCKHLALRWGLRWPPELHQSDPGPQHNVLISTGSVVIVDAQFNSSLHTIRDDGTLRFDPHANTLLSVDTIIVEPSGVFQMGISNYWRS